ncbi:MAG: Zn-dependent alcohol dehydrogenase [Acidimicrobiales bacterium]|nr:Zn-dependent alcohol dehydrogenase [Acidimicrobiales bacterium]
MRAAVLRGVGEPLTIEDVELDNPWPHEVIVRTAACGVCHSDLHFIEGHYGIDFPVVLGHEAAGVVEAVGSEVTYVQPGDRVITCMSVFCGRCADCAGGRPYLCTSPSVRRNPDDPSRLTLDDEPVTQLYELSAYAEQMLVHENAIVQVRDEMPLNRAALIGCAVMTGFGAVTNTARVSPGASVAVIGCGGVGLSVVNGAAITGAGRIIAVDVTEAKLDLARLVGATDVVNASRENPVEAVLELTKGGVEYSFEALGRSETAEQSFRMLRAGGTATVIGMVPEGQMMQVEAAQLLMEKRLQGSNMGSNRFRVDMPLLVDHYLEGRLLLDEVVDRHIHLEEVDAAFDEMRSGALGRSIVVFDG